MKFLILGLLLFLSGTEFAKSDVIYLEPLPDAEHVSIYNNLIIGLNEKIDAGSLNKISITVTGSKSGVYSGELTLTSDKKRILFKPDSPFQLDEEITVRIKSTNDAVRYKSSNDFVYSFHTETARRHRTTEEILRGELGNNFRAPFNINDLPPPKLTITQSNSPSQGKIFLTNFLAGGSSIIIADNHGDILFSRKVDFDAADFRLQENGTFTYFETKKNKYFQLNERFELVDSFYCGNGYTTDIHDMVLLPNNHAFLMSYDAQTVDMSKIVPGGNPKALVEGLIIQEIDENKNVVFQWRSWDHFQITDATHENLAGTYIDYVHGNAIEYDTDGNIMISSRHLEEITKIDVNSGNIIWRLGGKNNQFTFTNDPLRFSYQHDIRRISNGNITMFDNGNYHSPQFSRAVEYSIDEVNRTATLEWEYRNNPLIYSFAMGNVQRLENGNTIVGWGYYSTTLSEVSPTGEVKLEVKLPPNNYSYRTYKFNWDAVPVENISQSIPEQYELSQNYPNPFNPTTSISFSLPKTGIVTIKVYDAIGREVRTLLNDVRSAGNHNVVFDAENLSSGVYIYKIAAGDFTATKKMVLMK